MNSLATLRWNHGGRNVCSIARIRGGKITKSIDVHARRVARRLQHEEDRRIRMVVADRADRVEAREVVLVRHVVAVPRDDVERRVVDARADHRLPRNLATSSNSPSRSSYHAAGVRKSRGFARPFEPMTPEVGQAERRAEVLADVAARRVADSRPAARRESGCRAGSPRSRAARRRGGPARSRCAAGPAAARSAARRRRRRRSGPSSSGSPRTGGSRSPPSRAGSPLPAIVTRPSTKSVGAAGIGSGSQRSWFGGVGDVVERADDAAVADAAERLVHRAPAGCGTSTCAGSRRAAP